MEYEVIKSNGKRLPKAIFKRIDAAKNFRLKWLRKHLSVDKHDIFIYKSICDKVGIWWGETL